MKKVLKKFYPIIILLTTVLITHWRWIFINEYFSSGDSSQFSWFLATYKDIFMLPNAWTYYSSPIGFGGLNIILPMYPSLNFMFAGLVTLFHNPIIPSKLVYLIPAPVISIIGSYLLVNYLVKNKVAGIIGSIVYSYNTSALILQTGTIEWAVSYAFAPLVLYLFIVSLDKKKFSLSIITSFVGFIAGSYDFRILYIVLWVMVFYVLWQILFAIKDKLYSQILPLLLYGITPFIVIFLLSSFWLFPLYLSDKSQILGRALFGSQFFNLTEALTLFHPYWTGGAPSVFIVQPIPWYFWLIPVFVLLGFITNLKDKKIWFFSFIAILGVLLTKQEDNPFPHLYLWLYNNFPGFNAYREASKFYVLIALGYSVLIGGLVSSLIRTKIKIPFFICLRYLILTVIIGIFIWNAKPLITGKIGRLFTPISLPNDYKILAKILTNDNGYSKTLWVPYTSRWSFFDNNHPYWNLYSVSMWSEEFQKNPAYQAHTFHTSKIFTNLFGIVDLLDQSFTNNFLNISGSKYIIVPPQYKDTPDDDMFLGTSINDRPLLINILDNLKSIRRINIGTKDMVVYENPNFKPLIYTTPIMENAYQVVSFTKVKYKSINLSEYIVDINNLRKPIYLNFTNAYENGWVIDLGNGNYLPNKDHLQTDMQYNAFYINPGEIIKSYNKNLYIKNKDGSINIKLKLYYKPQNLVNIGTYISLVTLASVFAFLLLDLYRVKIKKDD